MEVILLKQKVTPEDSNTILSSELLKDTLNKEDINDLKNLINTLKEAIENIEQFNQTCTRDNIEKCMKVNNIFVTGIMNIIGNKSYEKDINEPGSIYFDPYNNQVRLRDNNSWKSIKLEE